MHSRVGRPDIKQLAAKSKKQPVVISKATKKNSKTRQSLPLSKDLLLQLHRFMVKSRVLEERLIKIYKSGESYFWIGGPGEEGFGVPLGLLANKGQGIEHDWFHLHYRCTPTLIAMGMPMIDSIRTTMNRATDPSTGGRNFSNHYCYPEWNIAPVTSPIEVQYPIALGTAWVQRREKAKGITVVSGGDAGTAEGDFASCLVWATRKGSELPMLLTVQNNKWGISTHFDSQHGEKFIADRGKAFGMRTNVINGNDVVECYKALQSEYEYIRKHRKPVLLEVLVSRLYGHSSASGANLATQEECCLKSFEQKLLKWDVISEKEIQVLYEEYSQESIQALEKVRQEVAPQSDTIWDHVYVNNENADWRKF